MTTLQRYFADWLPFALLPLSLYTVVNTNGKRVESRILETSKKKNTMSILNNLQEGIRNNEPISSLIQDVLNDVNFKAHGATQFYYNDYFRATTLTNAMAMIRDYAKQNGN